MSASRPVSKSDAFFSAAWSTATSPSASLWPQACSSLVPPPGLLSRRASDSALPPPCAGLVIAPPSPTTFRGRLSKTGNLHASRMPPRLAVDIVASSSDVRSRSCEPSIPSPTNRASTRQSAEDCTSALEKRLEEAVLHLETLQQSSDSPSTSTVKDRSFSSRLHNDHDYTPHGEQAEQDNDDDDSMYYNDPRDAARTLPFDCREDEAQDEAYEPFCANYPLEPLEIPYTPRHRLKTSSLKKALRALHLSLTSESCTRVAEKGAGEITKRIRSNPANGKVEDPCEPSTNNGKDEEGMRKVMFAETVQIVDVFAAVDYPARRGPPPIERLTMRDILELRTIKIELGVFGNNDPSACMEDADGLPSTPFEKMNIFESTPFSPVSASTSIHGHPPSSPFLPCRFGDDQGEEASTSGFFEFLRSAPTQGASSCPAASEAGICTQSKESCRLSSPPGASPRALDAVTSGASSYESSVSVSVSVSTSASSSSSSYVPTAISTNSSLSSFGNDLQDETLCGNAGEARPAIAEVSMRDRETSPDSLLTVGTVRSVISSPSWSLSCSPSVSDSEYYYGEGDDESDQDSRDMAGDPGPAQSDQSPARSAGDVGQARSKRSYGDEPDSAGSGAVTFNRSTRRSKNADYFRIPLPLPPMHNQQDKDTDKPASSGEKQHDPKLPIAVHPIIVLDGPWGLGQQI